MNTQHYNHLIEVKIPKDKAFKGISQVSAWWATDFEGDADELNDKFTVRFGLTFVDFTISEIIKGQKVVWLVTDCNLEWLKDKKEWKNTKVVWDVTTDGHSTRINMTHIGLIPTIECYKTCEKGWNTHIGESLYKFLTNGKGMPQPSKS